MTTPNTTDLLKYAELQMAAEAFLVADKITGQLRTDLDTALTEGNNHVSKFTETEATAFLDPQTGWTVVDQCANTKSGFSGTLFKNNKTGELVISFRSTEFIDDAARDNQATNTLEIADHGLAFGQIADMETWYAKLKQNGKITDPTQLSVTGYSLGGHLATAFNLLRTEENPPITLNKVVTFNGAGMGTWDTPTLSAVINRFNGLRNVADGESAAAHVEITDPELATLYNRVRDAIKAGQSAAADDVTQLQNWSDYAKSQQGLGNALAVKVGKQSDQILAALKNITTIRAELDRLKGLSSGVAGDPNPKPAEVPSDQIDQTSLDYQMALQLASQQTHSSSVIVNGVRALVGKTYAGAKLPNQFDVVGATTPSAVANSGTHYGTDVQVFIEDQPVYRGDVITKAISASWQAGGIKLLVPNYGTNDFGDTHSLVLLVDSLLVQNTILKLLPETSRKAAQDVISNVLRDASYLVASSNSGTQGKAEGDVLENVTNALADLALGAGKGDLKGKQEGNTWANATDREKLHSLLKQIADSDLFKNPNALNLALKESSASLKDTAHNDFGAYMALHSLSPFAFTGLSADKAKDIVSGTAYVTWEKDTTIQDPNKRSITDTWLTQRGAFLERKDWFGKNDINPVNPQYKINAGDADYLRESDKYFDVASDYTILQGALFENTPLHYFGGKDKDTATGSQVSDWIFGGDEADKLSSGKGADYLEGNSGDDTLNGDGDNDTLVGGEGNDVYAFDNDSGRDVIIDSDGKGSISLNGSTLTSSQLQKLRDGAYESADHKIHATVTGEAKNRSLEISFVDSNGTSNQISIKNWTNGDFDLNLEALSEAAFTADTTKAGDSTANILLRAAEDTGSTSFYGNDGNDVIGGSGDTTIISRDSEAFKWNDYSDDADLMEGGTGDDVLYGADGRDTLIGGADNDFMVAGYQPNEYWDDDAYRDGFQNDLVAWALWQFPKDRRATDSNIIDGGAGSDYIVGGWGDDVARGGVDNDALHGLAGADILFGDDGNDYIFGDGGTKFLATKEYYEAIYAESGIPMPPNNYNAAFDANWTPASLHGNDTLDGGTGNDTITGDGGSDVLYGSEGNDVLWGDIKKFSSKTYELDLVPIEIRGDDWLDGGAGSDLLVGDAGNDTLLGGTDSDTLYGDTDSPNLPTSRHGKDYLDGGDGNDSIYGNGEKDTLLGGAGNDLIYGDDKENFAITGDDSLDGGAGNDTLIGGAGNDTLYGGSGDDGLIGDNGSTSPETTGNDKLYGDAGADTLEGWAGNDLLDGGADNDYLYGDAGDDTLKGGDGNDSLYGGDGNDIFVGGNGTDGFYGGDGSDNYFFELGSSPLSAAGVESITDTSGSNKVVFGQGISPESMSTSFTAGGNLRIKYSGSNYLQLIGATKKATTFEFKSTGEILSSAQLVSRTNPTPVFSIDENGNVNQYGGNNGDNLVLGAKGIVYGGLGSDTISATEAGVDFVYSTGDGTDRVRAYKAPSSIDKNRIVFTQGIKPQDITSSLVGGDLIISISAQSGDAIIIEGFDPNDMLNSLSIDSFIFDDGTSLSALDVLKRGVLTLGGEQSEGLVGNGRNEIILGAEGNDTIIGHAGNDTLEGGQGDDQYQFNTDDGNDVIRDEYGETTLVFGEGIITSDIRAQMGSDSVGQTTLTLSYGSNGAKILLNADSITKINKIEGQGQAAITLTDVIRQSNIGLEFLATTASDRIEGNSSNDTISGLSGDDLIIGNDGQDVLDGGTGSDTLIGGNGSDRYLLSKEGGIDLIQDDQGANILKLNSGVNLSDLAFSKSGASLRITITNSVSTQVEIRDFYLGSSEWSIEDSNGVTHSIANLANEFLSANESVIATAQRAEFDAALRRDLLRKTFKSGHSTQNDGSFRYIGSTTFEPNTNLEDTTVFLNYRTTIDNSSDYLLNLPVSSSETTSSIFDSRVVAKTTYETTTSPGNIIQIVPSSLFPEYYAQSNNGWEPVYGSVPPYEITHWAQREPDIQTVGEKTVYETVNRTLYTTNTSIFIDQVYLGDSNNTIQWYDAIDGAHLLLDAGAGNDHIGGWGRDFLFKPGRDNPTDHTKGSFLYGNTGDDTICGSDNEDVLIGGQGSDLMDGGFQGDEYVLSRNTDGWDIIFDTGCITYYNPSGATDPVGVSHYDRFYVVNKSLVQQLVSNTNNEYPALPAQIAKLVDAQGGVEGFAESNEFDQVDQLVAKGLLVVDTVTFEQGLTKSDLSFAKGTTTVNGISRDCLDVSWGIGKGVHIVLPNTSDGIGTGIEKLAFSDGSTVSISEVMNAFLPKVTGTNSHDTLIGSTPKQMLIGEQGDDTYVVTNGVDIVVEQSNEGTDTVQSSTSYSLTNANNVENLFLTGTSSIIGTGNAISNTITGNSGANTLAGLDGNDTLVGVGQNDTLIGGRGNDTYVVDGDVHDWNGPLFYEIREAADEGNDTLITSESLTLADNVENLVLVGNQELSGWGNTLNNLTQGNDAANFINALSGNDTLYGRGGNDILSGDDGDDLLIGGSGDDLLEGGEGNDTYVFDVGDGYDNIRDLGSSLGDVLRLASGIFADEVRLTLADDGRAYLSIGDWGPDVAQMQSGIEFIEFADGTKWDLASLRTKPQLPSKFDDYINGTESSEMLIGLAGDDALFGRGGSDTLDGGAGFDYLDGGSGSDIYRFDSNFGRDAIYDGYENLSSSNQVVDSIIFSSLNSPSVQVARTERDIVLRISGTTDEIRLKDWFTDPAMKSKLVQFANGEIWTPGLLDSHIQATEATEGSDYLYGASGDDTLNGAGGNDVLGGDAGNDVLTGGDGDDELYGGTGLDRLRGGDGNDYLGRYAEVLSNGVLEGNQGDDAIDLLGAGSILGIGGAGNDCYWTINSASAVLSFNRGDGGDIVYLDTDNSERGLVAVSLGGGVSIADLRLSRESESADLVLEIGNSDSITFANWYALADRTTSLQIISTNSITVVNFSAVVAHFDAQWNADNAAVNWPIQQVATQNVLAAGTSQAFGGQAAIEYALRGSIDELSDSQIVDVMGNPLFGHLQAIDFAATHTNSNPAGTLSIAGLAQQGQTLTATNALTDADGLGAITYQWLRDGVASGSTGASYVLSQADVGSKLTVQATYTDGFGTNEAVSSASTASVANVNDAPTGGVTISGTAQQGQTLTAANTLADADGLGAITYQWLRDGVATGSTGASYVLSQTDVGKKLMVQATYTDGFGTDEAVSSASTALVANVNDAPTGGVTISGTAQQGQTLTATNTLADADGLGAITYQWLRDGVATGSSGASYVLSQTDVGKKLTVQATYTDGFGTNEAVRSASTASVANVNDAPTGGVTISGTAQQGQTLTATNTLADADGLGAITYQWLRNGTATGISGASYVLSATDVGSQISVKAVYTDGFGTNEAVSSSTTTAITALPTDVSSSVSYVMNATDRTLTLTGTSAINGTGNALDNKITGNSGSNVLDGGAGADTLIGGAGDDTYLVDSLSDVVTENASEGIDTVQSSVTWTLGLNTENLTLTGASQINGTGNSGDNVLLGNSASNTLTGGAGNDTLNGGLGNDTMVGGTGNDLYVVDASTDVVTENANEGVDTVQTGMTYSLASLTNVENLTLTGASLVNGTGNALANVLTGNSASNTLDGGTGIDTLIGGAGDDIYIVDSASDVVSENAPEGLDTVQSSATYSIASAVNVENLTLTGTSAINATGNSANNVLTGNSAGNSLTGGAGNDTLNGGAGNDTMVGGTGDDVYIIDVSTDVTTENANEGIDTVQSAITFSLASLANVENITLIGTSAVNATGNASSNYLVGNTGANILDGGAGVDTLAGGTGNDSYIVDSSADIITEMANEGTDSVTSSATFTLSGNLENLTLSGTSAINGTGNELANTLTGNSAANTLTGGVGNDTINGGAGADAMLGGTGDDNYIVDSTSDAITELLNDGTDSVQSSVTYTLATNVENLSLTGTTATNGTGNASNNWLVGNSAINTLTGGAGNDRLDGGAGADSLVGGTGDDIYVIDNASDKVTENSNEGIDQVQSSVTWTLGTNVENLTLTGTSAINGTGNTLDNWLLGNSAVNRLTGAAGNDTLDGGAGADSLVGGAGNDIYVVDNASDKVTEIAGEGTDTVQSSVTWALGANLENLTLTGITAINGTGNTLSNVLTGNSASNTLNGGGGNDTYRGGLGTDTLTSSVTTSNDTYIWGRGEGVDTLTDAGGTDQLSILSGVTADQVWLRKVGSNLEVSVIGSGDSFTVNGWYTAASNQVETLKLADGKTLTASNVQKLVDAMAQFALPAAGQTTLPANYQTTLNPVIAANWV